MKPRSCKGSGERIARSLGIRAKQFGLSCMSEKKILDDFKSCLDQSIDMVLFSGRFFYAFSTAWMMDDET